MTRPIRVMFLEPTGLISGGAVALLWVVQAMDKTAFRPLVVLGSDGPLVKRFRQVPGCRVLCRPLAPAFARVTRLSAASGMLRNLRSAVVYGLEMRRLADRWEADVLHANGLKAHLVSIVAARRRRRALVWHVRDTLAPPYMPSATARALRWLTARVPDVVVCNSESTRSHLSHAAQAEVIVDGLPLEPASSSAAARPAPPGPAPGHCRVLLLGRIAEWKGQHVFLRAVQRLCERDATTEFVIVGGATTDADATYAASLRALVRDFGLAARIQFTGFHEDVPELLRAVDILVHCSVSPEPLGLVILEAMRAGVPVVATNLGGPAEIIRDGENGRLYPPSDDAAMARVLQELLESPDARRRLAAAGRATVVERFGIERTVDALGRIYRRCAARRHTGQTVESA